MKGKKAFVTGASRGIGLRIARLLAAEGADVGICARDAGAVQETVAELKRLGARAFGAPADLKGDGADLKAAIDGAAQAFGGLDILIQNVSAMAVQMRQKDWDAGYQVDILGTLRTVDAAMPYLQKSAAGSIVVIGSIAAVSGNGGPQPYGALKAALVHYVSGLAHSLGPQNIRANTVSPGAVLFRRRCMGPGASRPPPSALTKPWRAIRWAAWRRPKRWRMPPCFWPARRPASSPASI